MPNETIDLVDERDAVIGETTMYRVHRTGELHRAAHVFVFNSKREIFLQLRPKTKLLSPGVWDSSVGEHVKRSESFEAAAMRGLEEELNIKNMRVSFVGEKKVCNKTSKYNNCEFSQLFECVFDGEIKISKPELEDGRFFSIENAKELIKQKKTSNAFKELLPFYLEKKEEFEKRTDWPFASVIIATFNNARVLERVLHGMLALDYPRDKVEIIVASDGSTDATAQLMKKKLGKEKRIKFLDLPHAGVCKARNAAIAAASEKNGIVVNMDHDCIPEKQWLKKIVSGFDSTNVGVVSSYNYYGGTSTAFRKDLLDKVQGYSEEYFYYREDTDLSFKIMDLGFAFRLVQADFEHDHKIAKPKGILGLAKHLLQRLRYHENDVLLYKKHQTKVCKEFLQIKLGFLVSPISDFRAATGTWHKGGKLKASSPRGITFIENKTPLHTVLIIILGICYAIALKLFRFWGSIKFWKFLI